MNLLHLKYAVEIVNTGSISKASEVLYISQPNLSRAIKELEEDLHINIFRRTSKGVELTPDGEIFIKYAKSVLKQVDEIEGIFNHKLEAKKTFSLSCPRASYICEAFTNFSTELANEENIELFYKETNSMRTLKNVLSGEYHLGIVRYSINYDTYFKNLFSDKNLNFEVLSEYVPEVLISNDSPLAALNELHTSDLKEYIEIAHADPFVPTIPFSIVKKEEIPADVKKRIFVFERATQFEILSHNLKTFMYVSPIPVDLQKRHNLTIRKVVDRDRKYRDVIIYHKDYKLTNVDKQFMTILINAKRRYF